MKNFISDVKTESFNLEGKSNDELQTQMGKLKRRQIEEGLESIIPQWFAMVQEVSFRNIGLKHFDTQLLAGFILHEGKIVEMKTGEGKTLASTLAVSLNALEQKGVHVVTVNDYLAERDQKLMGKIYNGLGLSVGLIKSTSDTREKRHSYQSDITYVTNSELVFDYLRDSCCYNLKELMQRPFSYCVIDEIDSILIDEARTPLILSTIKGKLDKNKLFLAKKVASGLQKDIHFQCDEKRKEINLTESGYEAARTKLGKETLYASNDPWILEILNALKATYMFKCNKDYIVLNNKILIVDEFTGRVMEDRRWSVGIHEAIEAKENVEIGLGTKTKSSITYQNFFTRYPKLAGMTGTAKTAEKEFEDIYNLEVVVLPTAKPMQRKDLSDLVYQTELAKWKAVLKKSKECFENGQPILIGTANVEKSEFLSELFEISKIPHQVLNAKPENVNRESEIIAQAGESYAVTIATNMAGRGTDIILGGNAVFQIKEKMRKIILEKEESELYGETVAAIYKDYGNDVELEIDILTLPYSFEYCEDTLKNFYNLLNKEIVSGWQKDNEFVKSVGGLLVIGTERHETRRIDNQLRGRAGRQGDPGSSQFFVSLEDKLIKVFGGDSIRRWVEYLVKEKDAALESDILTKSLENAQKKVEEYNYDLRKNVFQYDAILNTQRKELFEIRNEVLCKNITQEFFLRLAESFLDEEIILSSEELTSFKKECVFEKWFDDYSSFLDRKTPEDNYAELWISNDLRFAESNFYQTGFLKNNRMTIILSVIDFYWTEHLERMGYIRETVNWRAYGQQNPLTEYNEEALDSYKLMFAQIRSCMIYYFLNNRLR